MYCIVIIFIPVTLSLHELPTAAITASFSQSKEYGSTLLDPERVTTTLSVSFSVELEVVL